MSIDQVVMDAVITGMFFTTAESLFNSALHLEHNIRQPKTSLPCQQEGSIRGHSYPIMFPFGSLASLADTYAIPPIEQVTGTPTAYCIFGLGFFATEYLCHLAGHAPWREVYSYLRQRFEKITTLPLTAGNDSVFFPLLPAWIGMAYTTHLLRETLRAIY